MSNQTAIQLGGIKVSALTLGIAGSVVAHAAVLSGLYVTLGGDEAEVVAPRPQFARGAPIQVRLVEPDMPETTTEETNADRAPAMTTNADLATRRSPHIAIEPAKTAEAVIEPPRVVIHELASGDIADSAEHSTEMPPPDWCRELIASFSAAVEALATSPRSARSQVTADRPRSSDQTAVPVAIETPAPPPTLSVIEMTMAIRMPSEQPADVSESTEARNASATSRSAPPSSPRQSGIEEGVAALDLPRPTYPRRSIRLEEEGTVLVVIQVLANGKVGSVRIHRSSGHRRLDDAALEAARGGRFQPATRDGRAIDAPVVVPFEFYLK